MEGGTPGLAAHPDGRVLVIGHSGTLAAMNALSAGGDDQRKAKVPLDFCAVSTWHVLAGPSHGSAAGLEPAVDIARRVQRTSRSNVSPVALDTVRRLIDDTVADYERVGPAALVGEVVTQRRWVDELLSATQPPRERLALFDAAARMAGLLAAMALDLGHPRAGTPLSAKLT